jgi:uncharacterized protein YecT (DUF1311 family)
MRALAILLLLAPLIARGQTLSFEPGGREACAQALHLELPSSNDGLRSFSAACAVRDLAIEKTQFEALSNSEESRSPEERVAFNALMVSFATFRDAQLKSSQCGVDSGCSPDNLKAQHNFDFLQLSQQKIEVPTATAEDLTSADAALNTLYEKAFASLPASCAAADKSFCQSQPELRDVQRDWIRYRDAWLTFATLHSPAVTRETWLTFLTRQRAAQLQTTFRF